MEPIQDDIAEYEPFDQDKWLTKPWRFDRADVVAWEAAHGHDARVKCYVEFGCQVIEPTLERRIDRLVAERDRLQAEVQNSYPSDVVDNLRAERDRLKEKADYWERQYVIESENADDFHAERDRLIQALEQLLRASGFFRNDPDDEIAATGLKQAQTVAREALTKTTEEQG
jgi:hypothetical protein